MWMERTSAQSASGPATRNQIPPPKSTASSTSVSVPAWPLESLASDAPRSP